VRPLDWILLVFALGAFYRWVATYANNHQIVLNHPKAQSILFRRLMMWVLPVAIIVYRVWG